MPHSYPGLVAMTRRVTFSSGHRYWLRGLSDQENRSRFGKWASPYSHGHNYALEVTVEGEVDPRSGMVLNIKRLDDLLRSRVVGVFDGRSINDEVPYFAEMPPTLENLMLYIWNELGGSCGLDWGDGLGSGWSEFDRSLAQGVRLTKIRLEGTPLLYGELEGMNLSLTRSYEFAASHRLHVPTMSEEENITLFGKCNNEAGHGHNYVLEVTVEGDPDPQTGMIVHLEEMDDIVNRLIVERYDHKNLNVDVPELQGLVASSEVVAFKIFENLRDSLPVKLKKVRLQETARNFFEVTG